MLGIQLKQWGRTPENIPKPRKFNQQSAVDVLTGKIGATKAITMRKLKVKGNLANLLKHKRAIDRYVEVLGEVTAEFEGDYA